LLVAGVSAGAVVPGSVDEEFADVGVAGLGDRALDAGLPGGVLREDQADERADGVTAAPAPVADIDRQREPGQRGDTAQASQPAGQAGELRSRGELVMAVSSQPRRGLDNQYGAVAGVERRLQHK
jgi:hypothetical protein